MEGHTESTENTERLRDGEGHTDLTDPTERLDFTQKSQKAQKSQKSQKSQKAQKAQKASWRKGSVASVFTARQLNGGDIQSVWRPQTGGMEAPNGEDWTLL